MSKKNKEQKEEKKLKKEEKALKKGAHGNDLLACSTRIRPVTSGTSSIL